MDLKALLKELSALQKEISELRTGLARLEQEVFTGEGALQRAIKARGMQVHRHNPGDELIFSPQATSEERIAIYELLQHYSFRLFLRDVINNKESFRAEGLVRYCSFETAERYLSSLCELKLAEPLKGKEGSFRLANRDLYSFGPTLEWFVAQMFRREFASPAIYGVRFKETASGGDYDVIAFWEGRLVYVEIKSSPPRGIERQEIGSFLARITDLVPDIAFFFNDTQLRMKDKIVLMFEEVLHERFDRRSCELFPLTRLVDELFHINHRIFIVNSKRDVAANFNYCLRDFLLHERAVLFPIVPPHAD
jgi:hypothetical protein